MYNSIIHFTYKNENIFFNSMQHYLLNTYCVPDSVLDNRDTDNKIVIVPPLTRAKGC